MEELNDLELINLFLKDAKQVNVVFSKLLKKYNQQIYWQIRRTTKNHDSSNDILQNVWLKVFKNLSKFKQESSFYTWLYRIAHNETINFLTKENKMAHVSVEESYLEIVAGHEKLQNFSAEEISEKLMSAVSQLSEKQALVFQLKFYEDLKYSEISKQLNVSEGGLKANYHLAVKKIEAILLSQLNLFE